MVSTILTEGLISEVHDIAKGYGRIIDDIFEIRQARSHEARNRENDKKFEFLQQIIRDLTGYLALISKLTFYGRPEDLKDALSEVNMLIGLCKMKVQIPPITNLYESRRNPPPKREHAPTETSEAGGEQVKTLPPEELAAKDKNIRQLEKTLAQLAEERATRIRARGRPAKEN